MTRRSIIKSVAALALVPKLSAAPTGYNIDPTRPRLLQVLAQTFDQLQPGLPPLTPKQQELLKSKLRQMANEVYLMGGMGES